MSIWTTSGFILLSESNLIWENWGFFCSAYVIISEISPSSTWIIAECNMSVNSTSKPLISVCSDSSVSFLSVVIATVVLVLISLAVVVIRYMFRHKGSYRTNEAKGMEFAETADTALRGDPALRDAMDVSKKEYYIWAWTSEWFWCRFMWFFEDQQQDAQQGKKIHLHICSFYISVTNLTSVWKQNICVWRPILYLVCLCKLSSMEEMALVSGKMHFQVKTLWTQICREHGMWIYSSNLLDTRVTQGSNLFTACRNYF